MPVNPEHDLIDHMIRRKLSSWHRRVPRRDLDDLYQELYLEALLACNRFVSDGRPFEPYLQHIINISLPAYLARRDAPVSGRRSTDCRELWQIVRCAFERISLNEYQYRADLNDYRDRANDVDGERAVILHKVRERVTAVLTKDGPVVGVAILRVLAHNTRSAQAAKDANVDVRQLYDACRLAKLRLSRDPVLREAWMSL